MATTAQPAQLTDLIAKARRHWSIIAIGVLLGAALGAAASFGLPKSYDATARIEVNPIDTDQRTSPEPAANMPTEEELVTSYAVASAASERLGNEYAQTPDEVREATAVTVPENSWVLVVTYTGSTAKSAAAGANALAEAYLQARKESAESDRQRRATEAQTKLTSLQQRAANASEAERRVIAVQVSAVANRLASLSNIDTDPGTVIGRAIVPTSATGPGLIPLVIGGGFAGLLIGAPIALSRRDERTTVTDISVLKTLGSQVIVDGTHDSSRSDTWDTAAFKLKIPKESNDAGYVVVVDAADSPGRIVAPGQELVDALGRLGTPARYVDGTGIDPDTIDRGWPTEERVSTWVGKVVVVDAAGLKPAATVAIASRSDAIMVTRTGSDSTSDLKELAAALKAQNVTLTAAVLFPVRP